MALLIKAVFVSILSIRSMSKDRKRLRPQKLNRSASIKAPASAEQSKSTNNERPIFCFEFTSKPYCLTDCDKTHQASLATTLYKLSQFTWNELTNAGRHQLGYEKIAKSSIKTPLPRSVAPDVTLIAFRYHSKHPVVGYRSQRTFHILWLDRDFSLYNHG